MYFPIEREVPFVDRAFTFFMHHHVELGVIFFGVIFIAFFLLMGISDYLHDKRRARVYGKKDVGTKAGCDEGVQQDISAAVQAAVDAVLRQRGLL